MPIEEKMVRYAAPTLAGCKAANLFNLPKSICQAEDLQKCKNCLSCSGLDIQVLLEKGCCRLLYVYRHSALREILNQEKIQEFLAQYGWKVYDNEEEAVKTFSLYANCRAELCARYRQGSSLADLSVVG